MTTLNHTCCACEYRINGYCHLHNEYVSAKHECDEFFRLRDLEPPDDWDEDVVREAVKNEE